MPVIFVTHKRLEMLPGDAFLRAQTA